MRAGEISLAIEIPPNFGRDVRRNGTGQINASGKVSNSVQIGAWVDGSMPRRAETVQGYLMGMHQDWQRERASLKAGHAVVGNASAFTPAVVETRFRYNPDVLGSILNLYVTPVTRSEFLLGK